MSSSLLSRSTLTTAALALVLTAACGSSGKASSGMASSGKASPNAAPKPTGTVVNTGLLAFDPKSVDVKKGQTVTWVGGDNITHVLVEGGYQVGADGLRTQETDDKAFHLSLSKKGQQVSHTYDKAGTFTYYCTIHHGMNGTVVVS
jgi:plastocyanin